MEGGSGKSGVEDGTEEKLVSPEEPQSEESKDKNDSKYTADIQNGETKMDCDMRRAFVGMGKEELMKFANDPFWVLTRQFLFILFWIMWVAMLVGSIAIVVYSPKCTSSKTPPFKDSVVYKFDIKAFEHGSLHNRIGDLKALGDQLHYFDYLGVDSILINSLMETADKHRDTVKDFRKMDFAYGSFEILKDLTSKMKKKNIRLIMSVDPNHSSDRHEWFRNSIAKIDPYTNYYVWAQGTFSADDNTPVPPNNWHSIKGGSAWSYVKERNQFYLHQFSSHQPDLNFRQDNVKNYLKQTILFWLDQGLNGIHLENAKFLVEDISLKNETINPIPGATHEDYNFYSHTSTTYDPLTLDIIKEWAEAVESRGDILSVSDFNPDNLDSHLIVYHTMKLKSIIDANEFDKSVKANLARKNPTWLWGCHLDCPDERTSKALTSMFVLLPGIAVIRGGEELPWMPSANSPWTSRVMNGTLTNQFDYFLKTIDEEKANSDSYLNSFRKLLELRKVDAFKFGKTDHRVLNSTVFSFVRIYSDYSYLVAFNFDETERTVSFSTFPEISNDLELTLIHVSVRTPELQLQEKTSPYITLPGKTMVVFKFPYVSVVSSS